MGTTDADEFRQVDREYRDLLAQADQLRARRDEIVERMARAESVRKAADRLGLSPQRVQQMATRAREASRTT